MPQETPHVTILSDGDTARNFYRALGSQYWDLLNTRSLGVLVPLARKLVEAGNEDTFEDLLRLDASGTLRHSDLHGDQELDPGLNVLVQTSVSPGLGMRALTEYGMDELDVIKLVMEDASGHPGCAGTELHAQLLHEGAHWDRAYEVGNILCGTVGRFPGLPHDDVKAEDCYPQWRSYLRRAGHEGLRTAEHYQQVRSELDGSLRASSPAQKEIFFQLLQDGAEPKDAATMSHALTQ